MSIPIVSIHFGLTFDILGRKQGPNVNFNHRNPHKFESSVISRIFIYRASRPVKGS